MDYGFVGTHLILKRVVLCTYCMWRRDVDPQKQRKPVSAKSQKHSPSLKVFYGEMVSPHCERYAKISRNDWSICQIHIDRKHQVSLTKPFWDNTIFNSG